MNANNLTIDQIPFSEDDYFEFKSSLIDQNKLKDSLQKAVSGFANAGGGYFIVGINDETGEVDGGIEKNIGKRPILDWVDNVISQVQPVPKYSVNLLEDIGIRGRINKNHVVLIVAINESNIGPHMAPDNHYYIRAGRHTVPARHFIVEAIRGKRYNAKPKLTHLFRLKPSYEQVLQLGIVALTNSPAINVTLSLEPLPKHLQSQEKDFPIIIPLIDSQNPFYFDVALYAGSAASFGYNVKLGLDYSDLLQNHYKEELLIGVESTPPLNIGDRDKKFLEVLQSIEKAIAKLSN